MKIAVFGAGGVGGYFGGRLAQAGEEVVFIARGPHLAAMQAGGLRVDSIKGDFHVQMVQASADPAAVGPVEAVLVAVKAWQVPEAAEAMRPMVGAGTMVVPLSNGVEAPEQLAAVLGDGPVLGGLCRISALLAGPGHIRHVGIEPAIALGELDGRRSERVAALAAVLARSGISVDTPEDIRVAMWEKFTFIAALSGMGSVARAPAGVLRSLPGTREMLVAAMEEIVRVGRSRGVGLGDDLVARTLRFIDGLPAGVTASMQRDIYAGRPSELAAQNGAVVRMGQAVGISTPVNAFIYNSLLPQEMRARGEIEF